MSPATCSFSEALEFLVIDGHTVSRVAWSDYKSLSYDPVHNRIILEEGVEWIPDQDSILATDWHIHTLIK